MIKLVTHCGCTRVFTFDFCEGREYIDIPIRGGVRRFRFYRNYKTDPGTEREVEVAEYREWD